MMNATQTTQVQPGRRTARWCAVALSAVALLFAAAPPATHASEDGPTAAARPSTIDLNEATAETLATLPGIGPSKAEAIVAYRSRRAFRRIEDILRVRGIGRATFRAIRDRISVRSERRQRN